MTTLPTSPFPELRPLEESRQVPSLADLLSKTSGLPIQTGAPESTGSKVPKDASGSRAPLRVSTFPRTKDPTTSHPAPSGPFSEMPVSSPAPKAPRPSPASIAALMAAPPDKPVDPQASPAAAEAVSSPLAHTTADKTAPSPDAFPQPEVCPPAATDPADLAPRADSPGATPAGPARPVSPSTPLPVAPPRPATTDDDLQDALLPILEATLDRAFSSPQHGLYTHLEPMLRSTVRRAIAEQMQSSGQFRQVGTADRLAWRLNALFTSRSYEDIVFERTRRYQVEELYLLRKDSHTLISYASHDPVRHASPRRVDSTVETIASQLLGPDGDLQESFELPERRVALVRNGRHAILVAIIRGSSNALVRADLDYLLRQAEDRYHDHLEEETDIFVHALQPILEGGLLIQSPAAPQ